MIKNLAVLFVKSDHQPVFCMQFSIKMDSFSCIPFLVGFQNFTFTK